MAGEASDAEILARIARGDTEALGVLYDRYVGVLFPLARRILGSDSDAEDLIHDAFVRVSERAAQFDVQRGSAVAWLVMLVRNLGIDRQRRRASHGRIERGVLSQPDEPPARDAEEAAELAEARARIRSALASLPEAERATLELAFFGGLSYGEIAALHHVPLGTVKSRAARAFATLRGALGEHSPAAAAGQRVRPDEASAPRDAGDASDAGDAAISAPRAGDPAGRAREAPGAPSRKEP